MLLSVSDLHKSYAGPDGDLPVLRGIKMLLARGETLALTGESGSGKSTLLHIIGGLDQPDSGIVAVDGVDIGAMDDAGRAGMRRHRVSVVFQQFNLIPSLTVASNIGFHARLSGRLDQNWIKELADRLGLSAQLGKYPEQLSGGQQQRVAIARTLAAKPALILADEPTGNLDEETADKVMELMMTLAIETDAALLLVTHSHRLAGRMGRRLHLRAGQIERAEE
ncbi:ABC transporter ATP-binding protein [Planktomarina temperata]|nr:ABC transporter ATP-binding protein [Planktomarina temperata]